VLSFLEDRGCLSPATEISAGLSGRETACLPPPGGCINFFFFFFFFFFFSATAGLPASVQHLHRSAGRFLCLPASLDSAFHYMPPGLSTINKHAWFTRARPD